MTIPDALDAVVDQLVDAGLPATRDNGAFYPAPIGVLVGMPSVTAGGMATRTLIVPVHGLLYAAADDAADALQTATYSPTTWQGGPNAEPLPAILLNVTVTIERT